MQQRLLSLGLVGLVFLGQTSVALASPTEVTQVTAGEVAGKWTGEIPVPGRIERTTYELWLVREEQALRGAIETDRGDVLEVKGTWNATNHRAELEGTFRGQAFSLAVAPKDGRLVGTLDLWGGTIAFDAGRPDPAAREAVAELEVDLTVEPPVTVSLDGLPPELAEKVDATLESIGAVGISAAFVVDGEVIDVRSRGWEDFHNRIPATGETSYRWASISKPLTAVAALQLAAAGKLDLDRDVRKYVPEFPEKRWAMTSRQLLCHQAGVTHYRDMRVRTVKEYDLEHPWTDAIIALDMFNETDLLFEPGSDYSYTTPGYVLLGAVIERAAEGTYVEQVLERICKPLGMTSMQPDRPWAGTPHRTRGYHRTSDERVVDSGDNNICWKIAAGGWTSTVGDLARFGAGLMGSELLDLESQLAMWEPQRTAKGTLTDYGLGVGVGTLGDVRTISHSGGQLKTSTYLIACPDYGLAVALMCNTSGTGLGGPARSLLSAMVAHYGD